MLQKLIICIVLLMLTLELPQLVSDSTAVTSYLANLSFRGNLHEVVPNKLFRSATLSQDFLEEVISEKKIKTVIDLRRSKESPQPGESSEEELVAKNGAKYIHIPLNSGRLPSRERILPLLEAFKTAETPVLVHCTSGTHRTGVASAMWLLAIEKLDLPLASKQLSLKYGYFYAERLLKSLSSGYPTIDQLIWSYQDYQTKEKLDFETWLTRIHQVKDPDEQRLDQPDEQRLSEPDEQRLNENE